MNSENKFTTNDSNLTLTYDQYLDARDLSCPLPLLKAKQQLNSLDVGQVLLVQASDPGSWADFASYASLSAHQLVMSEKSGSTFNFLLQKGE